MEDGQAGNGQIGVRARTELMYRSVQGLSEDEKIELMQGWCRRIGDFELVWIQELARTERWERSMRTQHEAGRDEMPRWMDTMRVRASEQGSQVGRRWWSARIAEWEAASEERRDEMQDTLGTGRWGEGVRNEWREFQGQQREADRRSGRRRRQRGQVQVWRLVLESESNSD